MLRRIKNIISVFFLSVLVLLLGSGNQISKAQKAFAHHGHLELIGASDVLSAISSKTIVPQFYNIELRHDNRLIPPDFYSFVKEASITFPKQIRSYSSLSDNANTAYRDTLPVYLKIRVLLI